ncbi:MAG TPA: chorismate-binding protein [Parachlamydiaceae bacterium]|nr:chorismate-binding protein [Parachlamydiaceae bacterium]
MNREILSAFLKKGTIVPKDHDNLWIGWGKRAWSPAPISEVSPNFYFPDFFLKVGMPWFSHENWMEISLQELKDALEEEKEPIDEKLDWELTGLGFFEAVFKNLMEKIKKKELAKAVPYLFEKTGKRMCKARLLNSLFKALAYAERHPAFIYGLWGDEEGFLGATPEALFEFKHNQLKTTACAGTLSANEKISKKLLLEHDLVVEGIASSLSPFGELEMQPKEQIPFANFTHLVTPIKVRLKNPPQFKKLVSALHPTPALGAFPKEKGMAFLEEFQMRLPRDRFGAPVGYLFKEEAFSVVAIRNVQWGLFGMKIGAGCGIVEGSLFEDELNEVKLKLKATREILQL